MTILSHKNTTNPFAKDQIHNHTRNNIHEHMVAPHRAPHHAYAGGPAGEVPHVAPRQAALLGASRGGPLASRHASPRQGAD